MKANECLLRADVYRLLAAAFAHPSAERVSQLKDLIESLIEAVEGEGPIVEAALIEKIELLKSELEGADRQALEGEYLRLFSTSVAVPPCESSYEMADKGAILADVSGFYRAFGLKGGVAEEVVDSMGHELEFMGVLTLKEAIGKETGLREEVSVTVEAQKDFLQTHLGRWYKKFAHLLGERADCTFYKLCGQLLEIWIERELGEMNVEPEPPPAT